jgi:hypothetical protein
MSINANVRRCATVLLFLGVATVCGAQTEKASLESYIAGSEAEADSNPAPMTIKEWSARHPGEVVEDPLDKDSSYHPENIYQLSPREQQNMSWKNGGASGPLRKSISGAESMFAGSRSFTSP